MLTQVRKLGVELNQGAQHPPHLSQSPFCLGWHLSQVGSLYMIMIIRAPISKIVVRKLFP